MDENRRLIASTSTRRNDAVSWGACAIAIAVALAILARYAAGYFFLFDDYALIGIARTQRFDSLFTTPFIGFFRPAGFALLWIGARAFDWDAPGGYLATILVLHALNGACAYGLARTVSLDRLASTLAALLLWLSPWSTEAFLWISGLFDVLATTGVLASLLCLRLIVVRSRSATTTALLGAGAVVAALLALFSKESAIVLPILAIVWLAVPAETRPSRRRLAWMIASVMLPAVLYLGVRASVLGVAAGAYGSFGDLWTRADVAQNLWSYVRAVVLPPMPSDWSIATVAFRLGWMYPFLGAVAPAILFRGVRERPFVMLACAASLLVSLAPVAWTGLAPNHTVSGRFAYLPGAWFALAAACALGRVMQPTRDMGSTRATRAVRLQPIVAAAALVVATGYYTGSLIHQASLWRSACALSRSVMQQMDAHRGRTDRALYVTNLPYSSTEGPWILKTYAFRFYRDGKGMPPVRSDIVLVRLADGPAVVAPLGADPFSEFSAPDGRPETPVTVSLAPAPP